MNSDLNVAVHAAVYLSHKAVPLSSDDLAANICTNAVRVRRVMAKLVHAGIAQAREGHEGGYRLAVPADELTVRAIADALDTRFVSAPWSSGDTDMDCLVSSGMGRIMDGIYDDLDALCRRRLDDIRISDIEQDIFGADAAEQEGEVAS